MSVNGLDGWVLTAAACDACGRPRARGELFGGAYGRDGRRGAVCGECFGRIAADPVEYRSRIPIQVSSVRVMTEMPVVVVCSCCGGREFWRDGTGARICVRCRPDQS